MKITKSPKRTPEIGDLCVTTKKCILEWIPGARRTQQVEKGTLVLVVGFHPKYDASYIIFGEDVRWLFNSEMKIVQTAESAQENK
jgi:hypothetical protein